MRYLKFKVEGQKLEKNGDFNDIVAGSKGYLVADFSFDNDWKGLAKVAVFEAIGTTIPVSIDKYGQCNVPNEVTDKDYINVKVIGKKENVTIVTNYVMFFQKQ